MTIWLSLEKYETNDKIDAYKTNYKDIITIHIFNNDFFNYLHHYILNFCFMTGNFVKVKHF